MQDLRLVGVHDDGSHLLLSGTGGVMFRLPIDEALRVASRPSAKASGSVGAIAIAMSPRDIQSRIRSGATAADVAEISGLPLAKVERYEGPVLAEREYVAQQARNLEVASPIPGQEVHRSAFGDNPASLGEMVAHRLTAHGLDSSAVEWDSWRRPDGSWTVVARFETKLDQNSGIGEEPPAMWTFSPSRKTLQNANRWAQQLSELEPLDGPVPARRLSAVSDRPFNFETDAESAAAKSGAGQDKDPNGLLDMLRARRGQRLGVDEDGDDALAFLLAHGVPAAHPRPSEVTHEPAGGGADQESPAPGRPGPDQVAEEVTQAAHIDSLTPAEPLTRRRDGRPSMLSRLNLAPRNHDADNDALKLHNGVSTETREVTITASQLRPAGPTVGPPAAGSGRAGEEAPTINVGLDELLGGARPCRERDDAAEGSRAGRDANQPERQPSKPKRSSVPSWDEIVFGTRGD